MYLKVNDKIIKRMVNKNEKQRKHWKLSKNIFFSILQVCPHGSIEPRLAETGPRADTHLRIHNRYTAARRPAGTGRLFVAAPGQMEGWRHV